MGKVLLVLIIRGLLTSFLLQVFRWQSAGGHAVAPAPALTATAALVWEVCCIRRHTPMRPPVSSARCRHFDDLSLPKRQSCPMFRSDYPPGPRQKATSVRLLAPPFAQRMTAGLQLAFLGVKRVLRPSCPSRFSLSRLMFDALDAIGAGPDYSQCQQRLERKPTKNPHIPTLEMTDSERKRSKQ
ncbi:hypothetical protein B0T22DRAFT_441751 [Podospora appendiculata]|uniref:Secreted protein n=1 Tax=Podospora appendiculata TaxID=314037 RepID=A0AAE1CE51_9PEZI|nr:hypothetical protein B0T22DRAFT_441751 [Podospora appendiculata]